MMDTVSFFFSPISGDKAPAQNICTWLQCHGRGIVVDRNVYAHPYDIYVIGTQESAMTEKDWVNFIKKQITQCGFAEIEVVCISFLIYIEWIYVKQYPHVLPNSTSN